MNLPKIGQIYDYFDDGKIKESRRAKVLITKIVPFNEIDAETLALWEEEVSDDVRNNPLYAKQTECFIFGKLTELKHEVIFVQTTREYEWFSLGYWGGILDIDGHYAKLLES
jgi:hypothetical protein